MTPRSDPMITASTSSSRTTVICTRHLFQGSDFQQPQGTDGSARIRCRCNPLAQAAAGAGVVPSRSAALRASSVSTTRVATSSRAITPATRKTAGRPKY